MTLFFFSCKHSICYLNTTCLFFIFVIAAANKAEDGSKRSVSKNDVKTFAQTEQLDCIEVSAKENKNVNIVRN